MFPDFIQRRFQEVRAVDPRNLDGVLEREEQSFARPLFGRLFQQILPFVKNLARGDVIAVTSGEDGGESAFAAAVRAHDRMDLAFVDGEVDAFENLFAFYSGGKVLNFQYGLLHLIYR